MPSTSNRPLQTDGNNCDVFVMFYMDYLARGITLTNEMFFNPDLCRSEIAFLLIRNSLSMDNMCLMCLNTTQP